MCLRCWSKIYRQDYFRKSNAQEEYSDKSNRKLLALGQVRKYFTHVLNIACDDRESWQVEGCTGVYRKKNIAIGIFDIVPAFQCKTFQDKFQGQTLSICEQYTYQVGVGYCSLED